MVPTLLEAELGVRLNLALPAAEIGFNGDIRFSKNSMVSKDMSSLFIILKFNLSKRLLSIDLIPTVTKVIKYTLVNRCLNVFKLEAVKT